MKEAKHNALTTVNINITIGPNGLIDSVICEY